MSNNQTNWILNLIDRITAPMRNATEATNGMEHAVEQVQAAVNLSAKDTKAALQNETKNRKDLLGRIKEQERALKELEKQQKAVAPGEQWQRVQTEINQTTRRINGLREAFQASEADINDLTEASRRFGQSQEGWDNSITNINQFTELTDKVKQSLNFSNEISAISVNIQRMTGSSGDELDDLTSKAVRLGEVYGEDSQEIARAANATAKQMGISYSEAFDLIDQGFQKGANLNGDLLDQLKEYGPQMKLAGISASQGIALMAKAGKDGVFSDKAIDAIKEAGLSLREMGKPQVDALKGIGIEVKDLAGKTSFEASQMIAKAMQGATIQARQLALTDIFKGAGEDAGLGFIMGLADVDMDINNVPSVQQSGEAMNTFLADLKSGISNTFSDGVTYVQNFAEVAGSLETASGFIKGLSNITWVQTAATKVATGAQWLWNAAMSANPIALVIIGITAMIAIVAVAWNKFEGFRAVIFGLWEVFKTVFNNIAGLFKVVFAPIGEAISALMAGDWKRAAGAVLQINPIAMAVNAGKYIAGGGLSKGVSEAYDRGDAMGRKSFKDSQKEEAKKPASKIDALNSGGATKLDGIIPPDKSKKGKKGSDGLEIGGSGGSKSIVMNLDIKNYFSNTGKTDIRKLADEVAGKINDRLRDAAIDL